MMVRAGKLDRTIKIQRQTGGVSAAGSRTAANWQTFATARAQLIERSTREVLADHGDMDRNLAVFRIRWLGGIETTDRVQYGDQNYDIKSIAEIGRRNGLDLHCERVA